MLKKLFGDKSASPERLKPGERMRAIEGSNSAELAATLLIAPTALMQLNSDEARIIVSFMVPRIVTSGTTLIKEGDTADTDFMLLLLEGEVTVENIVVSRSTPVTVTVLGPGGLIGEMGLVDGKARLASCIATTDAQCAVLTRAALEKLSDQDPKTAAKLILAVALRIADRLRDTAEKLHMYSQLVQAMQQEIDHLMPG